jgi:hypothetical protein
VGLGGAGWDGIGLGGRDWGGVGWGGVGWGGVGWGGVGWGRVIQYAANYHSLWVDAFVKECAVQNYNNRHTSGMLRDERAWVPHRKYALNLRNGEEMTSMDRLGEGVEVGSI